MKANELVQMTSAITHQVEEDVVTHVELIAQVDQILTLDPNSSEEADSREAIILILKQDKIPKDLGEAHQIKWRAMRFILIGDNLYK